MAGIIFFYENNYTDVFSGIDAILPEWNNICKIGQINKAIIVNKTQQNIVSFDASMDIQIVSELPSDLTNVTQFVCPWEADYNYVTLQQFDHDVDWYVFGPASGWKGQDLGGKYVTLPQEGRGALHSLHVASTVMFDRFYKMNTQWQ